jgi:tRNA dimethylallyltransferase
MRRDMILILGVTGSGKGRLAFDLARDLGAEIISIDSMKVYRRMDIGTAKPPKEARAQVKHHLIDIIEPSDSFSVRSFLDNALEAIKQIKAGNKPVVAVGGTSLYIKALLYGLFEGPAADKQIRAELRARAETQGLDQLYRQLTQADPEAAARIHQNDARRIIRALEVYELTGKPISSFQRQWNPQQTSDERRATDYDWTIIGLRRDKAEENKRINARVKKMIAAGLVDEVKSLLSEEKPLSPQARCAIGYAEVIDHLSGKTTLEDAIELIKKNTRRLAKSQRTWFKTFRSVHWLDIESTESDETIFRHCKKLISDRK